MHLNTKAQAPKVVNAAPRLRPYTAEMFETGYLFGPRMRGRKPALYRRLAQCETLNTGEWVPLGDL
jgi:hypothetical protein